MFLSPGNRKSALFAPQWSKMKFIIVYLHLPCRCDLSVIITDDWVYQYCVNQTPFLDIIIIMTLIESRQQLQKPRDQATIKSTLNRSPGGDDVTFGFFQPQLIEVVSVTKTKPRCISHVRKLYATITEAKHRKPLGPDRNTLLDASNAYSYGRVWPYGENTLKRITYSLLLFNSVPELPILQKTMGVTNFSYSAVPTVLEVKIQIN